MSVWGWFRSWLRRTELRQQELPQSPHSSSFSLFCISFSPLLFLSPASFIHMRSLLFPACCHPSCLLTLPRSYLNGKLFVFVYWKCDLTQCVCMHSLMCLSFSLSFFSASLSSLLFSKQIYRKQFFKLKFGKCVCSFSLNSTANSDLRYEPHCVVLFDVFMCWCGRLCWYTWHFSEMIYTLCVCMF